MGIEECINKVKRYLSKDSTLPILVDIQNVSDLKKFRDEICGFGGEYVKASSFCKDDELLSIDKIVDYIENNSTKKMILLGVSTLLYFNGNRQLLDDLTTLLNTSIESGVVIITYHCKDILNDACRIDERLLNRVNIIEGIADEIPDLFFSGKEMPDKQHYTCGIQNVAEYIENNQCKELFVKTKQRAGRYPNSKYQIRDIHEAYDLLSHIDKNILSIDKELGEKENWEELLQLVEKYGSFEQVINKKFASVNNLVPNQLSCYKKNSIDKWLYFIAIKHYGISCNSYLDLVARKTNSFNDFVHNIVFTILECIEDSINFNKIYEERKEILSYLTYKMYKTEMKNFCGMLDNLIESKQAIYCLTDASTEEKQKVFYFLDKYDYSENELNNVLKIVYPELYQYLKSFLFPKNLKTFNEYFDQYKYCKLSNVITEQFNELVKAEAIDRNYNAKLLPRDYYLDQIDKTKCKAYFIDAMGVEYLGLISEKCKEKGLSVNVKIGKSELPSITSMNSAYKEIFDKAGVEVVIDKSLDNVKHHGVNDCNYEKTKLPIYILDELDIIDKIIDKIADDLSSEQIDKAVVFSDHGASRLAVINEQENLYEMSKKGQYSGRCCPIDDFDVTNKSITQENGYWVLSDYSRFKGSRKANFEVHGGATLEEVVVPIIEIKQQQVNPIIKIKEDVIQVSFRKKAEIILITNKKIDDLSIMVDNKYYYAKEDNDCQYVVEMSDLKQAKEYEFSIYIGNNEIKSG